MFKSRDFRLKLLTLDKKIVGLLRKRTSWPFSSPMTRLYLYVQINSLPCPTGASAITHEVAVRVAVQYICAACNYYCINKKKLNKSNWNSIWLHFWYNLLNLCIWIAFFISPFVVYTVLFTWWFYAWCSVRHFSIYIYKIITLFTEDIFYLCCFIVSWGLDISIVNWNVVWWVRYTHYIYFVQ